MWTKKNKTLLIILIALIAVLGVDQIVSQQHSKSTFKDLLITTDTSQIGAIEFYHKNNTAKKITIQRKGDKWFVSSYKGTYPADQDVVKELLTTLSDLRPIQVMGNDKKAWETYGVTDTNAINVIVRNKNGKEIAHLYLGQIQIPEQTKQQGPQVSTYVRLKGDKNVYLIPHILATSFLDDPDHYRNNNLTPTFSPDITRVDIKLADTAFYIQKINGRWAMGKHKADSLNCERYARLLNKIEGSEFASEQEVKNAKPLEQITIHYADSTKITIKALGDTTVKYFWSSYNPQAFFKDRILYNRIFKRPKFFRYKKDRN